MPSRTKAEGAAAARLGMQLAKMLQPTIGQLIRNFASSATTGAMAGAAVGAATGGTISPTMDLGRAEL